MYNVLLVGIGGFLGASLRYIITLFSTRILGNNYPFGTLFVNILGCFTIGILMGSMNLSDNSKLLLVTGVLGGLTTFSTFAFETTNMLTGGRLILGLFNIIINVVLCLAGVMIGKLMFIR